MSHLCLKIVRNFSFIEFVLRRPPVVITRVNVVMGYVLTSICNIMWTQGC